MDANDSNAVARKCTWGLDLSGLSGKNGVDGIHSADGIGGLLAIEDVNAGGGSANSYWYFYDANSNVGQLIKASDRSLAAQYVRNKSTEHDVPVCPWESDDDLHWFGMSLCRLVPASAEICITDWLAYRNHDRRQRPGPAAAEPADVRQLSLEPRHFRTRFGGLFLFLPFLARVPLDRILDHAGFPGSQMVPAGNAMRSLLALKLFGSARHSHVMSDVFDEGLALFAGLNVIPKRSFLTEYSCRIDPQCYPKVMQEWFDAAGKLGLERGASFNLDFHTIPYHGDDALVEKHYVSKRSRRQKGLLAGNHFGRFSVRQAVRLDRLGARGAGYHFGRFWREAALR